MTHLQKMAIMSPPTYKALLPRKQIFIQTCTAPPHIQTAPLYRNSNKPFCSRATHECLKCVSYSLVPSRDPALGLEDRGPHKKQPPLPLGPERYAYVENLLQDSSLQNVSQANTSDLAEARGPGGDPCSSIEPPCFVGTTEKRKRLMGNRFFGVR